MLGFGPIASLPLSGTSGAPPEEPGVSALLLAETPFVAPRSIAEEIASSSAVVLPPVLSQSVEQAASSTTTTITLTHAQNAGDLLVVFFGNEGSGGSVGATPVSDTAGNTWTAVRSNDTLGAVHGWAYYAANCKAAAGGANTITITWGAATSFSFIFVLEYSGIVTVNPLDTSNAQTLNTTTPSVTLTTTNANDLIVACLIPDAGSGTTQGSGYTLETTTGAGNPTTPDLAVGVEDKTVSAAGSIVANFTVGSGDNVLMGLAFKIASGGATLVSEDALPALITPDNVCGPALAAILAFGVSEDLARVAAPFDESGPPPAWTDPTVVLPPPVGEEISSIGVEELSQWWSPDPLPIFVPFAPTSEDLSSAAAAALDEASASPALFLDAWAPLLAVAPEELAGLPVEEPSQWQTPTPDLPPALPPTQPEDFQGFLTVDDGPGSAWAPTDGPTWLTYSPSEDFAGFLTIDDAPGPAAVQTLPVDASYFATAVAEDVAQAASAGLEDGGSPVLTLEPAAWVLQSPAGEDLARVAAPFDESAPTWVTPELLPWLTPSIAEDFTQTTATGLDDGGLAASLPAELPAWIGATVLEDLARAAAPFDEAAPTWIAPELPSWLTPSVGEDFAQSSATGLDDGGLGAWQPLESSTYVFLSIAEDVGASVALEEASGSWLSADASSWIAQPAPPEEIAATVALEESPLAATQIDSGYTARLDGLVEELPSALPVEEPGGQFALFLESFPWIPTTISEDIAGRLTPDEGGQPFVWPVVAPDAWPAIAAMMFGEDWSTPLPPPAPRVQFVVDSSTPDIVVATGLTVIVVPNQ